MLDLLSDSSDWIVFQLGTFLHYSVLGVDLSVIIVVNVLFVCLSVFWWFVFQVGWLVACLYCGFLFVYFCFVCLYFGSVVLSFSFFLSK